MKPDGKLDEGALRAKFNLNVDTLNKALDTCKAQGKIYQYFFLVNNFG